LGNFLLFISDVLSQQGWAKARHARKSIHARDNSAVPTNKPAKSTLVVVGTARCFLPRGDGRALDRAFAQPTNCVICAPWAILQRREPVQDRCKIGNRLDFLFS
jgi:hypothetical protein